MTTAAPDAVLFDLDGTLVDSERENVESVVLAARRWGAELTEDERAFVIGHSWNEIHARIVGNHRLDVPMAVLIEAAVQEKRGLLAAGYRALVGAVAAVRRLERLSPLAVVSGASHGEVVDALESLGITDAFEFVMGAEDYPRGKPAPDPYAMAMVRLGAAPARTPTTRAPAASAEVIPGVASSSTMVRAGAAPRRRMASAYGSGAGLPRG